MTMAVSLSGMTKKGISGLVIVLGITMCVPNSFAAPRSLRKTLVKIAEHVSIGAGTEFAVAHIGTGRRADWQAGLVAVGLVAAFKEGSDVVSGRDTIPRAIFHASIIAVGGGIVVGFDHSYLGGVSTRHTAPLVRPIGPAMPFQTQH